MITVDAVNPQFEQPEQIVEEELVDYEEEDESMVTTTERVAENGKDATKKYELIS